MTLLVALEYVVYQDDFGNWRALEEGHILRTDEPDEARIVEQHPSISRSAEKGSKVLMRAYSTSQRGLKLVKRGGVWEALSAVSHDELEATELYYLGGHSHDVTLRLEPSLSRLGW